jgi:hypothetical protein
MKNSSDTIGNRTRGLPTCSAVPQPTAPPRIPNIYGRLNKLNVSDNAWIDTDLTTARMCIVDAVVISCD